MSMKSSLFLLEICILSISSSVLAGNGNDVNDVIRTLESFQEGYIHRDTTLIDTFVEDLFTDDILIVGTGASEWPKGKEAVKQLVRGDWLYWGDLKLDIEHALVSTEGKVAWFAVQGTSTRSFPSEDEILHRYGINDIERILDHDKSDKMKLLDIIQDAGKILLEVETAGAKFVYPIRVVGTLVRTGGKLKFKQMAFSYPYPRQLIVD